jgi:hypothetical protein
MGETIQPNAEMLRLRDMLDVEGIEWQDDSDAYFCRTRVMRDGETAVSNICGIHAYGTIEVWTRTMHICKEDPVGVATAEEAFELIREEVGR